LLGQTEPLELGSSPNHQSSKFGITIREAWSEISHTGSVIRSGTEYPVEPSPALGFDFALQGRSNLLFAARAKFQCDALFGTRSEAAADVIAADDQISAVISAAAYQDVHVGIVGVPMIHRDPVQPCIKVTFGIGHQFAGEGAEVSHLSRVLRRDRESEMMPIILAPLCKCLGVCLLRGRAEHPRAGTVARDPFPLKVCNVL
jgi:hypothetical protein